jgi:hypothetical protein
MSTSDVSYAFNASAIGVGGVINNPTRKVIPSLASVALAPTGGNGSSIVTGYSQNGVEFSLAYTYVTGEETAPGVFVTRADVTIENLVLFNQLSIRRMSASVTSRREVAEDEAKISFHAEYQGVKIGTYELIPDVDLDLFTTFPTYDKFLEEVKAPGNGAKYKARFGWDPPADPAALTASTPKLEAIRASMLKGMKDSTSQKAVRRNGHTIAVRGFGKLRLAEVLLKPGRRRLSLLQLDFDRHVSPMMMSGAPDMGDDEMNLSVTATPDSPDSGTMTIASVEGNGTPIWPKYI